MACDGRDQDRYSATTLIASALGQRLTIHATKSRPLQPAQRTNAEKSQGEDLAPIDRPAQDCRWDSIIAHEMTRLILAERLP